MQLPGILTPHTVLIRDKTGDGAYGPILGDEREARRVKVNDEQRLIRATDSRETVSSATVIARPEHAPVPVGSEVTIWPGTAMERTAKVLAVARHHHPPGPEHYEIRLE